MRPLAFACLLLPSLAAADPSSALPAAWRSAHPGSPEPEACPHQDPIGWLDLGPPGRRLLYSLRYGVMVVDGDRPLAWLDLGCGSRAPRAGKDDSGVIGAELHSRRAGATEIALRTRQHGHCGLAGQWSLLRLEGAALVPLLTVDEEVDRACGALPRQRWRATITVVDPDTIRVAVGDTVTVHRRGADGRFTGSAASSHRP